METETKKILGSLRERPRSICIRSSSVRTTTRVGVQNGHTGSISVGLEHRPPLEAVIDAWRSFKGRPQDLELPSAPPPPIVYLTERIAPSRLST